MTSDAEVEELLADCPEPVARAALRVRAVLLDGRPGLAERVRLGWRSVNFHDPEAGFVCGLFPLGDRVQLVFERGAQLPDPQSRLTGSGRQVRALEFTAAEDVDPEVVLEFLDLAAEIGAGLRGRNRRGGARRGGELGPVVRG